jgi:PPK2 family polyphosphate:nucleotide phosphotransferase
MSADELTVRPGSRVDLSRLRADRTPGVKDRDDAEARTDELTERIGKLVHTLGADQRYAVLVVLQGMDTAGKDGTIRRVFQHVDPQLMRVATFKKPTDRELSHDYLWRIHAQTPRRGELVVFNRSHYEDVGIVRVHNLVPREVWSRRYEHINAFERMLSDSGTVVMKFFLHISKDEQKQRLQERLEDPSKNWKMDLADLHERKFWPKYMEAYSQALARCSTPHAPWHLIPADRKWYRDYAIARAVERRLSGLKLRYPRPAFDPAQVRVV